MTTHLRLGARVDTGHANKVCVRACVFVLFFGPFFFCAHVSKPFILLLLLDYSHEHDSSIHLGYSIPIRCVCVCVCRCVRACVNVCVWIFVNPKHTYRTFVVRLRCINTHTRTHTQARILSLQRRRTALHDANKHHTHTCDVCAYLFKQDDMRLIRGTKKNDAAHTQSTLHSYAIALRKLNKYSVNE